MLAEDVRLLRYEVLFRTVLGVLGAIELIAEAAAVDAVGGC